MKASFLYIFFAVSIRYATPQRPGPPSIARALDDVEKTTKDFASLRKAVRIAGQGKYILHPHLLSTEQHGTSSGVSSNYTRESQLSRIAALRPVISTVLDKLAAAGPSISCPWDDTVSSSLDMLFRAKYLLAANFKDNADVLPHIIREIWLFSSIMPPDSLYVSIYESGSSDGKTGQWLAILSRVLKLMRIQHRIVVEGALQRGANENRIDFLSKVRNKALEPLWTAQNHTQTQGQTSYPYAADRIIYMNDVFACTRDFIRLMLHETDMACALDFWHRNGEQEFFDLDDRKESIFTFTPRTRRLQAAIYDLWVLRDTDGNMFRGNDAQSQYSLKRLAEGLPFPVTSCWNGMVVMTAKPFRDGLRFRNHLKGECRASECSLLCHDLHRLGYGRIIVDPAVQLTYEHSDAAGMHVDDVVGNILQTSWEDVRRAPAINATQYARDSELCCNEDELKWKEGQLDCHMRSFLSPNYTALAFPSLGKPLTKKRKRFVLGKSFWLG